MKFSTFIQENLDAIVSAWEAFAATLPAARSMSGLALRDHCREMLTAIAIDMETSQTGEQQAAKSMDTTPPPSAEESAAESHGALRHLSGFDLVQLVAEFRALRASVLSLWEQSGHATAGKGSIQEITRFNEGLDQALAESVESYSTDMADSRDLFVGVLGHDLRSPLSAIALSNELLERPNLPAETRELAAARTGRAVREMNRLISDLLDYTRSRLGGGIPIEAVACDIGRVCREALDAIQASHPDRQFVLNLTGPLQAAADGAKLGQALANLLGNAVQHGAVAAPISLEAVPEGDSLLIRVSNQGEPIPASALHAIFEPLARAPSSTGAASERSRTSMGLGLFIAREIVNRHGGSISVESSAAATTFTIRLPRAGPGAALRPGTPA